jgi:hypothetical protein
MGEPTPLEPPRELPFLESLSWFDRGWRLLSPEDMLRRYEDGWRFRGVLAEPSAEELELIRELCRRYGSFLDVS